MKGVGLLESTNHCVSEERLALCTPHMGSQFRESVYLELEAEKKKLDQVSSILTKSCCISQSVIIENFSLKQKCKNEKEEYNFSMHVRAQVKTWTI